MNRYITKRNGNKVKFDLTKIENAVYRAARDVADTTGWTNKDCRSVAKSVAQDFEDAEYYHKDMTVEEIQDAVEELLMEDYPHVAKSYMIYRYEHQLARQKHNDEEILDMIENDPESYWTTENSNKNAKLVTVQRDYLAGITSTDIARNYIFPKKVIEAHDAGICHQHDMDYMAQATLHNCDLINLEDMLQNGTVINNVRINKPHRLLTAMTVTTQIMASVAANSYGGESITLTHLAPFVRDSYNIFKKKYEDVDIPQETKDELALADLKKEIADSVQTFNYQISTLFTLNG